MSVTSPTFRKTVTTGHQLTADGIWDIVAEKSFAILSHVTPYGEPRSSGVVYLVVGDRMYVAVAADGWKARHITAKGSIAITVPVRRGGLLALLAPIPPATISFPARAVVQPATSVDDYPELAGLARLLPPDRRDACSLLRIRPVGHYVTYGIGVPLRHMRDPDRARGRVPVA